MSFCEHMVDAYESGHSGDQSPEDKLLNIQNELIWGLTYRNYKEKEKNKPLVPLHSPINIPFELCRARMLQEGKVKKKDQSANSSTVKISQGKGNGEATGVQHSKKRKRRKMPLEKPTLLDRNIWSQTKYMCFLSVPNSKCEGPVPKKYKKRCEMEPCPPRFIQLAVPNKRRVFANWKEYANFLPVEMLMRYEEILHTDQNLDPKEARYYYKKLDRQKRKELKKKRILEKKKKLEKEKDSNWMRAHIDILAAGVLEYIQDEPLFALNYKQMLLSDGILNRLEQSKTIKKPSRKTKNHYKKTIIEVSDKFAIWIDTLTKFVDVQAVESDVDIPPVSVSSLYGESEGESGEESEFSSSSSSEQLRDSQLFEPEDGWTDGIEGESAKDVAESLLEDLFKPGEGEGPDELDEMLNGLDSDVLDKLIRILSDCSDDFLDGHIDDDKMPGVTYRDVLERLKELRDGLETEGNKPFLEKIMIDWAIRNDPDQVNDEILQKIHEVAGIISDFLQPKPPGGSEKDEEISGHEQETEVGDLSGEAGVMSGEAEGVMSGEEEGDDGQHVEKPDMQAVEGEEEDAQLGEEGSVGENEEAGADVVVGENDVPGAENEEELGVDSVEVGGEETPIVSGDEKDIKEQGGLSEGSFGFEFEEGAGKIPTDEELSEIGGEEVLVTEYDQTSADLEKIVGEAEEFEPPEFEFEAEEGALSPYRLDGRIIKGHKPSKVFEHSPDTVCCLSLKTWAVWLLEITHNAHNWTQWMSCVIQKIREYAAIVRGEAKSPDGQVKLLPKAEWRKFIKETEESVVAWRQYSAHVKDLSQSIVENFHNKKINCCPKCLQDHLITNVVVAHDTLQALTEAISCAAYWQRCLDTLVEKTCGLTDAKPGDDALRSSSDQSSEDADLEEVVGSQESGESIYEIEGIDQSESGPAT